MTITADEVASWGKLGPTPTGVELEHLELVIAAVIEHLETWYVIGDPMTFSQRQATLLQSVRVWKRRDTPEGIIAFDELGAVRVSAVDRDVEMLLERKPPAFS